MINKTTTHILVVDDNVSWLDLIKTLLESEGYIVRTASDFEQGERLLGAELFDLAVFDVRLTNRIYDVQGVTLLQQAKRLQPDVKAIILTGYASEEQRKKALDSFHADGYFDKVPNGEPLDIQSFSDLIHRLLNSGESSQENEYASEE